MPCHIGKIPWPVETVTAADGGKFESVGYRGADSALRTTEKGGPIFPGEVHVGGYTDVERVSLTSFKKRAVSASIF